MAPTVTMLAECLSLAEAVAEMRWREWGHPPEPEDRTWWLETTIREAGKETLPVTFVAHDPADGVLGAVGLDTYDLDERQDTSPWVTGMIVRRDRRRAGVGQTLMRHLERWAAEHRIAEARSAQTLRSSSTSGADGPWKKRSPGAAASTWLSSTRSFCSPRPALAALR